MTTRVALAVAVLIVAAPPWGTPKTEIGAVALRQGQGRLPRRPSRACRT